LIAIIIRSYGAFEKKDTTIGEWICRSEPSNTSYSTGSVTGAAKFDRCYVHQL